MMIETIKKWLIRIMIVFLVYTFIKFIIVMCLLFYGMWYLT